MVMRVLVACEYSGRGRDAFRRYGHDAWSCDLLECEADPQWHHQGPVEDLLGNGWDLMVAHPPCTHLAVSGSKHFAVKIADGRQQAALDFVRLLMDAPIDRWCIENPVSIISSAIRPPDQTIQPWEFGHQHQKTTCLWLKNLPRLRATNVVDRGEFVVTAGGNKLPAWYSIPPGPNRWKERSRTFQGIANAMGQQWGNKPLPLVANQLGLPFA
jgi:site-specific DNA-cytosine methylase